MRVIYWEPSETTITEDMLQEQIKGSHQYLHPSERHDFSDRKCWKCGPNFDKSNHKQHHVTAKEMCFCLICSVFNLRHTSRQENQTSGFVSHLLMFPPLRFFFLFMFQEYLKSTRPAPLTFGHVQIAFVMQLKAKIRQYARKTVQVRYTCMLFYCTDLEMWCI